MAEAKQALEHDYEQKMDHLAMLNECLASQPDATYPEVPATSAKPKSLPPPTSRSSSASSFSTPTAISTTRAKPT